MLRILELLGLTSSDGDRGLQTTSVRRIVEALEALEPQRAQFLAAFAYLLGRVAYADLEISSSEVRVMEEIVTRYGELPADQARLVVQIVRAEHLQRGGTQNFQVTREFRKISTEEQRAELLHCLFAVSAADDSISLAEEKQVHQIAEEFGFSRRDYIDIRSDYNAKRSVIRHMKDS